jgi:hypothetical protein
MLATRSSIIDVAATRSLDWWLEQRGYSAHRRQSIRSSLFMTGSLTEAIETGLLGLHHEDDATELVTRSMAAVPFSDAAWDDNDRWETGPAIPPDAILEPDFDDDAFEPSEDDEADRLAFTVASVRRRFRIFG